MSEPVIIDIPPSPPDVENPGEGGDDDEAPLFTLLIDDQVGGAGIYSMGPFDSEPEKLAVAREQLDAVAPTGRIMTPSEVSSLDEEYDDAYLVAIGNDDQVLAVVWEIEYKEQ